jgi:hypothetical protein
MRASKAHPEALERPVVGPVPMKAIRLRPDGAMVNVPLDHPEPPAKKEARK